MYIVVTWGTLKALLMTKLYPVSVKSDQLEVEAKQFLKLLRQSQRTAKLGEPLPG